MDKERCWSPVIQVLKFLFKGFYSWIIQFLNFIWDLFLRFYHARFHYFLLLYLLIVILFAFIYSFFPDSFKFDADREISFCDFFTFSIVTITTLGYGTIQPIGHVVRILACCEVIIGLLLLGLFLSMAINISVGEATYRTILKVRRQLRKPGSPEFILVSLILEHNDPEKIDEALNQYYPKLCIHYNADVWTQIATFCDRYTKVGALVAYVKKEEEIGKILKINQEEK